MSDFSLGWWWRLALAGSQGWCSCSLTCSQQDGRKNGKGKSECVTSCVEVKTVQQVKQKLNMQLKQNKFIHNFPLASRCSSISRKAGMPTVSHLLGKANAMTLNALLLHSSSPSASTAEHNMVWGISLVSWGKLSLLCPLTTSCAPQPTCGREVSNIEKALMLCKHNSAMAKIPGLCHKSKIQQHIFT